MRLMILFGWGVISRLVGLHFGWIKGCCESICLFEVLFRLEVLGLVQEETLANRSHQQNYIIHCFRIFSPTPQLPFMQWIRVFEEVKSLLALPFHYSEFLLLAQCVLLA